MRLVFPTSGLGRSTCFSKQNNLRILFHCYIYEQMREQVRSQEEGCLHWLCFKTWYPFASLKSIILVSLALGVIFITLSIVLFVIYSGSYSYKVVYSQNGRCEGTGNGTNCQLPIQLQHDLQPPILLLYTLDNVYINHRKYINSVSDPQIQGKAIDKAKADTQCTPFVLNKDIPVNKSYTGAALDPEQIAYPCGFKAFLTFNDTYSIYDPNGQKVVINEKNLDQQFSSIFNSRPGSANEQWIDVENEHYQQWIKNQAMISKFKLWGRIETRMPKGKYSLVAQNIYKIGDMRIQKGVELVKPTKLGGPIYFFPIAFAIMGFICVAYAIFLQCEMGDYDQTREKVQLSK